MKKTILITGINGFLGSHLAKKLKGNYEVIGLEYRTDNLHRIENENFNVYDSNDGNIEIIFKKYEIYAVLHVATVYRRLDEPILSLIQTNINLPVRLLELANIYKVKLYLNTDSFFNNADYSYSYLSDYTLSKKQSVEWLKLLSKCSSCKVVNMKIFHMYGTGDSPSKFIPSIVGKIKDNEPKIEFTLGEQTRDFIYIKDVVTAFECILLSQDKIQQFQEFEVGTGESHTIKELIIMIKELTSSTTDLRFGALPYRDGEIMESTSNNLALKSLGWNPKFTISLGIKEYLDEL